MKRKPPLPKEASDNYSISETELSLRRITFEVRRFCAEHRFEPDNFFNATQLRQFEDQAAQVMIKQIISRVAARKYAVKIVKFPADWKQGIKHAFAKWLNEHGLHKLATKMQNRWPVRFTEVSMEACAYDPEIAVPDRATFVEILHLARDKY